MREMDEVYADSSEPVRESRGVSRGRALKVGGLGLAGALAAFMPGRAGAVVRKKASNASCVGQGFVCISGNYPKLCGYDNYSIGACFCATIHYGKIRPKGAPVGACAENAPCATAEPCNSQKDCGPGYFCAVAGCCGELGYAPNACLHYCEQGSMGQAPRVGTPNTFASKAPKKH
jgi:hypothetical protein